jgi:hypothetical protein
MCHPSHSIAAQAQSAVNSLSVGRSITRAQNEGERLQRKRRKREGKKRQQQGLISGSTGRRNKKREKY